MSQAVIQASFNSGEWSPTLNARVDLAKYRSGAALLQNFFVDYRGGASTRPGTQYILQAYKSSQHVRIIDMQASFTVGYVLELGDFYMRFYNNGSPVLEDAFDISGVDLTDPCVIEVVGNDFVVGDWVFINGVVGTTQLNGKYFEVLAVAGNDVTLGRILDGADIDATGYTAYISDGTVARVYTLITPWAADDLMLLKFQVDVNAMRFTHPDYQPYILTLITANNWTLLPIVFGTTVSAPTGIGAATTLGPGSVFYSYTVVALDANGQESGAGTPATLSSLLDLRTTAGSNTITWNAVPGAIGYNIYKAEIRYGGAVPAGATHGYIGFATGTTFIDSNIAPDFSITPAIVQNPFQGAGIASVAVTAPGDYTGLAVPTATATAAPAGGVTATLQVSVGVLSATNSTLNPGVLSVGQELIPHTGTYGGNTFGGFRLRVTQVTPSILLEVMNQGSISSGTATNPIAMARSGSPGEGVGNIIPVWGVILVSVISPGAGYLVTPTITFSVGAAAATATLGAASGGNPAAIGVFQQRQVYGGPTRAPLQFNLSQPGAPNNFNISNPLRPSDAIQGQLVSQVLNSIKAFVQMPSGLIILTDRAAWLLNAGSSNEAVSQVNVTANAQSYNGISDVPPIIANADILYVQAKGSSVRNLSYNFQQNIFTGTDISVQSSHLFFDHNVDEWCWSEEPFKIAWCIRNDGVLLSLTFLKEQEFIAWAHSHTDGLFKSVANIIEAEGAIIRDVVYLCVEREIDGNTVKYIERMVPRTFENGVIDAWCVDAGLLYEGAPESDFTGGEHLAGKTVTGLADGEVITPFVMPDDGNFSLPDGPFEKVVIGLAFTCDLQTLALDVGEPTIQGKVKQISYVTVRVADTLGLKIGSSFDTLVPMKDLIRGEVSSTKVGQPEDQQIVTDLVTGDAKTQLDSTYTVPGQYCIRQDQPLPATILGVIPQVMVGNTSGDKSGRRSP